MSKRQKKRNSLLLYEFLVRTISSGLIEDDKKRSSVALKILRKPFKPGSELYKEFRLMNALAKTTVSSDTVASSIIKEAKEAVKTFDADKLDREKSLAIRSINHMLNDEYFYDQHVNEYRTFATIQTLVNQWMSKDPDISKLAVAEDRVMTHLLAEKASSSETPLSEETNGSARLLMKIMTKKLNEKYNGVLSEQQRAIVKAYAYSAASEDDSSIKMKLEEVKRRLTEEIAKATLTVENAHLKEKLSLASESIASETLAVVDDDTVTRFMLYSKLSDELEGND